MGLFSFENERSLFPICVKSSNKKIVWKIVCVVYEYFHQVIKCVLQSLSINCTVDETFDWLCIFICKHKAINANAELAENKLGGMFEWKSGAKHLRVSRGIIFRLFYWWRRPIIIFHQLCK